MKRANIFKLSPTEGGRKRLFELADNCSRMYNEINFKRRQSFFRGKIDWNTDEFYHRYKKLVGSATAQQIIIKNNESWKSFFALIKAYKAGKIEDRPHPPGYWKDRTTGKRTLRVLIRNDTYRLGDKYLELPFGLRVEWKGKNRWKGKQGRLEIQYDDLSGQWYAFQPVEASPLHQPIGNKKAYVDLGVKCPIVANVEGRVWGYKANSMLAEWWDQTRRIAECQRELHRTGRRSSRKLRKLYRKRKRRLRSKINKIIADFVDRCWVLGVSEIICGDLRGIRASAKFNKKSNSIIHNFWSVGFLYERLKTKTEEYGITVKREDERGTSSKCPRCRSICVIKKGRLLKCMNCELEAHRDAVGCINLSLAQGEVLPAEVITRAVTRPLLLPVEAGTSHASA